MKSLFACLILSLSSVTFCKTASCPRGHEVLDYGRERCFEVYTQKSWSDTKFYCRERLSVSSVVGVEVRTEKFKLLTKMWVDSRRAYPDGPFVDWDVRSERMGEPIFSEELWTSNETRSGDCLTYDLSDEVYSVVDCEEKHDIACVSDPYRSYLRNGECDDDYYFIPAPIPVCITKRYHSNEGSLEDLKNICASKNGTLSMEGWIHTKHPFLLESTVKMDFIPTGMSKSSNGLYCGYSRCLTNIYKGPKKLQEFIYYKQPIVIYDDNGYAIIDNKNLKYDYFFCEKTIYKKDKIILSVKDEELYASTENGAELDDLLCFTDSKKYYPVPVTTRKINRNTAKIYANANGYYWCVSKNFNNLLWPNEPLLWIDKSNTMPTDVLLLDLPPYTWDYIDINNTKFGSYSSLKSKMEAYWEKSIKDVIHQKTDVLCIIETPFKYKVLSNGLLMLPLITHHYTSRPGTFEGPNQHFAFVYPKEPNLDPHWMYKVTRKGISDGFYVLSKTVVKYNDFSNARIISEKTWGGIEINGPDVKEFYDDFYHNMTMIMSNAHKMYVTNILTISILCEIFRRIFLN